MLLLARMDLSIAQMSRPVALGHQTSLSKHMTLKLHKKPGTLGLKSKGIDKIRRRGWNVCHSFSKMVRLKLHQPHILNTQSYNLEERVHVY